MSQERAVELFTNIKEHCPGEELVWFVRAHEHARNDRRAIQRRLRAAHRSSIARVRGRGPSGQSTDHAERGRDLARQYQRLWAAEQTLAAAMRLALVAHPLNMWLMQFREVDPAQLARWIVSLDLQSHSSVEDLWDHCGLATVPGELFRCCECGGRFVFAVGHAPSGGHRPDGTARWCEGELTYVRGPEGGIVAIQRPSSAATYPYDAGAKKLCYLIAFRMIRGEGRFARIFRKACIRLRGRPFDAAKTVERSALRITLRQMLRELWRAWTIGAGSASERAPS
jgi:hypothetical protein